MTFKPVLYTRANGAHYPVPGVLWSWRILGATGTRRINAGNVSGTGRGRSTRQQRAFRALAPWPPPKNLYVSITRQRGARVRGRVGQMPCATLRAIYRGARFASLTIARPPGGQGLTNGARGRLTAAVSQRTGRRSPTSCGGSVKPSPKKIKKVWGNY